MSVAGVRAGRAIPADSDTRRIFTGPKRPGRAGLIQIRKRIQPGQRDEKTISELAAAGTTGRDQKIAARSVGLEAKRGKTGVRALAEAKRPQLCRYPLQVKRPSRLSE